jgi:tetratricopeptide (TPR) repeat protein
LTLGCPWSGGGPARFFSNPFVGFQPQITLTWIEGQMPKLNGITPLRVFLIVWVAGGLLGLLSFTTSAEDRVAPLLKGIGDLHHSVTTSSPEAQKYFDQALTLLYAFNHYESERSFRQVAQLDPNCAMAYWGQAMALGPNINDPVPDAEREQKGYQAIQKAQALADKASAPERALIAALATRHAAQPDRPALNLAYAEAMEKVAEGYPGDPDIQVLYADALMNTTPWDYWLKGGEPKPLTKKVLAALDGVMKKHPNHAGAHHYHIHAVEAVDPDRAEASADKLGGLVPVAGHLVHMPGHIYIRVGRYEDAAEANRKAIAADESYLTQCRAQGMYPIGYYPHNIHFLWAALTMQGHGVEAIEAARKAASQHNHEHMHKPGFGFPHLLSAVPTFALVRFGKFDEVLAAPEPDESMQFARGIRHFARGMAYRANDDVPAAEQELAALREIAARPELTQLKVFDVNALSSLLEIATKMLEGEIEAAKGNFDQAEKLLRAAADSEDALLYTEPPDWPQPVRHSLGAVLLEAGRPADAEKVYHEDLVRHRGNGWSLFGLMESLRAQERMAEAAKVEKQFRKAWAEADVQLTSSRF